MFTKTLTSMRATAGDDCDIIVVDDGSPAPDLIKALGLACEEHGAEFIDKGRNEGFAITVNVGMRRALNEGRDAILVNSDVEFGLTKDWVGLAPPQTNCGGEGGAGGVGAVLLHRNALVQRAGVYFSFWTRDFSRRFQYGPG